MRLSISPREKTEKVLNNYLKAFTKGDIDTVMDDFAKDAVCRLLQTRWGVTGQRSNKKIF